jgi:hypothetical protein
MPGFTLYSLKSFTLVFFTKIYIHKPQQSHPHESLWKEIPYYSVFQFFVTLQHTTKNSSEKVTLYWGFECTVWYARTNITGSRT